jgi:hypothetical protein
VRSIYAGSTHYEIVQSKDGGAFTTIARIAHDPRRWSYSWRTAVLDDLSLYAWIVYSYEENGNQGHNKGITGETIVRTPDAPQFTMTLDEGTGKVTFAEAA